MLRVAWIVPVVILLGAFIPGLPYGYFTFLRFVVCGTSGFLAWRQYEQDDMTFWVYMFGFVALLFNPIFPVYLSREIWVVIDACTAAMFALHYFTAGRRLFEQAPRD